MVISWRSETHLRVSWLSHARTDITFPSKATDYFSHVHYRWKTKYRQKGSLPQLGIEPATFRSQVKHATISASLPGHKDIMQLLCEYFFLERHTLVLNPFPNDKY